MRAIEKRIRIKLHFMYFVFRTRSTFYCINYFGLARLVYELNKFNIEVFIV